MSKSYKLFCSQVSGKQPKLLTQEQRNILKGYNQLEQAFYQYFLQLNINDYGYGLQKFLPKYHGVFSIDNIPIINHNQKVNDPNTMKWLNHLKTRYQVRNPQNKFIALQNIISSYKKPNVIDIKLGKKYRKANKMQKQQPKYFFFLHGCRMNVKTNDNRNYDSFQVLFFSKYFYKTIQTQQGIIQHLALFFFDGQKVNVKLLQKVIQQMRGLILQLKCLKGWKLYSTSLCIFYDAEDNDRFDVKILDFGRSFYTRQQIIQQATIKGLENVHRLLMKISCTYKQIEQRLQQMKTRYLQQSIVIIPQRKIMQYEGVGKQRKNQPTNYLINSANNN